MKHRTGFFVVLAGATLGWSGSLIAGGAVGQDPSSKTDSKVMQVAISDGALSLNGKKLDLLVPAQELVKLLGKPTRESRLASTILTWDDLGICAYVDPKREKITAVHFSLKKESYAFTPKKVFAGRTTLDSTEVTAESTVEGINAANKGKPFEKVASEIPNWWKAEFLSAVVYVQTAKNPEKGIVYLEITASGK